MTFDLEQLAQRLTTAAERTKGLVVTVSTFDLIISQAGYGTLRSESIPFASLFVSDEDVLNKALDRLQAAPKILQSPDNDGDTHG